MPISKYFSGHGEEVMKSMMTRYGRKKGKSVFYATANKRGQTAEDYTSPKHSHPFSMDPEGKMCMICGRGKSAHKIK